MLDVLLLKKLARKELIKNIFTQFGYKSNIDVGFYTQTAVNYFPNKSKLVFLNINVYGYRNANDIFLVMNMQFE